MNIKDFIIKLKKSDINLNISDLRIIIDGPKDKVSKDILLTIKENKEEIIGYLKNLKSQKDYYSINVAIEKEYYSLSPAQKRLYFIQQMDLGSTVYNMPYLIPLGENVDKKKIEEVFQKLILRHESFRTSFEIKGEEPVQRINEQVGLKIEEYLIEKDEINNFRNQFTQAFNIFQAPLLRVAVVEIKGKDSVLIVDMHHIISDGFSRNILEKEFQALYLGKELPALKLQYKDYSEWQNSEERQKKVKEQEIYWLGKFDHEIPVLNLPTDYMRPIIQSNEGATVYFALSKEETDIIRILSGSNGITLYMSVLSVFNILLSKLSNQEDIIVGSPILGRNHPDLENIVGMFVNTIVIRNEVQGDNTINDFTKHLKQTTIEAFEHQDYQFEDLVEKVLLERDLSRNPIFDVMFNMLNQDDYEGDLSIFNNNELVHMSGISKFDLTLKAFDYGEQLMLSFEYCTKLFKPDTIERYIGYFKQIVNQIIQPDRNISEIEIISESEKQKLLYEFNGTEVDYPKEKTIHQLFDEQVAKTPDNIAIAFGKESLTYSELNKKSNLLAQYLKNKNVGSNSIVGLFFDPSLEITISIIGVLKSGAAYLPINSEFPQDRINYMISDSGSNIVLTNNTTEFNFLPETDVIDFNSTLYKDDNNDLADAGNNLTSAYVIYTSGTTGKPKGVLISHQNIINYINWFENVITINKNDRAVLTTTYTFDAINTLLFGALLSGARLSIIPKSVYVNPKSLIEFIDKENITLLKMTPTLFTAVINYDMLEKKSLSTLRFLMFGGDSINTSNVEKFHNHNKKSRIMNHYGPTETTVGSIATFINLDSLSDYILRPYIGNPINNTNIYILNESNEIKSIGIPGEVCISGDGLALGYLNNPEFTSDKFISHPFKEGERLYRTGDLARWLPDGNIELIGRIDNQVKIRGYRLELGEIENVLLKHKSIKESVVLAREEGGEKYLCAYIVKEGDFNQEELRTYLIQQLPDYMIPSYFVELGKIPLTTNGKIDRKALPSPEVKAGDDYVSPGNETEEKLVDIWSEILNISKEEISTGANFFSIGGHSLKATILTGKIHKELNVEFALRDVFIHSTIQQQANQIGAAAKEDFLSIPKAKYQDNYALSSAQKRLYILQQMELDSTAYNMFYIIPLEPNPDNEKIEGIFRQLISRHENFRTSFEIKGEEPIQRIHEQVDFNIKEYLVDKEIIPDIQDQFIQAFDLSLAPLIRVAIVNVKGENSLLMVDIHHIISDGTSHAILKQDFQKLYKGEELPILKLQYKDFSEWQNSKEQQDRINSQKVYWINKFNGELPVLNLPMDYVRPVMQSFEGATVNFVLSKEETEIIKSLARNNELTLYMSILSVFTILLSKLSGQEDIIVGTPIAGRRHVDLEGIVGMFVNTLSMRNVVKENDSLKDFMGRLKLITLEAFENQDYQFEDLVEKISVERDTSRNPVFDVMFNMLNQDDFDGDLSTFKNDELIHRKGTSKFDLTLVAFDYGDQILLNFEYCTKLFKPDTIERYIGYFLQIIKEIGVNSELLISELEIISEAEKQELLYEFNYTKVDYPKDKTIHQLFEEQVQRTPDSAALVVKNNIITYRKLNADVNRIANYLLSRRKLKIEESIGIIIDRTPNLIISILSILKAGCAYVPIDTSLPDDRVKAIIKDAEIGLILSEKQFVRQLNRLQWECNTFHTFLCMDSNNIFEEEEDQKNNLMSEELWGYIGETAVDEITGGGWQSSYTGEPLTSKEMDEYGDNIFKKIKQLLHKEMRILEIGCATGITMYRIAPCVKYYHGTDLSKTIIEYNNKRIIEEGYDNISLSYLAAHEIDQIKGEKYDLIILNSVVQYFHGHNYLRKVINKAINLLSDKGWLVIGDVMDQDLKEDLIESTKSFKSKHKNKKTKTEWSEELFISRSFFEDLSIDLPVIDKIEFTEKIYTIENELTKFRYDTLIKIDKTRKSSKLKNRKHKYQEDIRSLQNLSEKEINIPVNATNLAYIIYTSGSTGTPKGVVIEHRNIVNFIFGMTNLISFKEKDILLSLTTVSFDIFGLEIFVPLTNGSSLVLGGNEDKLSPQNISSIILNKNVGILQVTPSMLKMLISDKESAKTLGLVNNLLVGGEEFPLSLLNELRDQFQSKIYNMYGPTETTIWSTVKDVSETKALNIGKPIINTQIYILGGRNKLQAIGVPGELCIAGDGLARGYNKNEELTQEKFIDHPYKEGEKLYCTGDLARWLSNGDIEFIGRMDHQVKIRGFRIELGEIENTLLKHASVKESVVLAREENGDKYLCAYIVCEGELSHEELRTFLLTSLPDYMIPSYFVMLDSLPLTTSGKVNRKILPSPEVNAGESYVAASNETEEQLVKIWSDVLNIPKEEISVAANFFTIGGHSLKATILSGKIFKEINVEFALRDVFMYSTIQQQADQIGVSVKKDFLSIPKAVYQDYYALSSAQKRLYLLQQMELDSTAYNMPYVIPLREDFEKSKIENVFEELITRHESFRTSFEIEGEEPVQRIHEQVDFNIAEFSVEKEALQGIRHQFIQAFDLSQSPLLRVGIVEVKGENSLLMIDMHHIISDGTSHIILEKEFQAIFSGEKLTPLPLQYKDYSEWQNSKKQQEVIKDQEKYWLNKFEGEIPVLNLPTDYVRPLIQSFEGATVSFVLNKEETEGIRLFVEKNELTLYMSLLSVFSILLSKLSGQDDIVVGTPIEGRNHYDLENIVGMFINTLSIRNEVKVEQTIKEFVSSLKQTVLGAYENQNYQFEDLLDKVNIKRDTSRNPIFDVAINLLNQAELNGDLSGIDNHIHTKGVAKFDLTLTAIDYEKELLISFNYCTQLFKAETIDRFIIYFKQIVSQLSSRSEIKISEIDILTEEEKHQLLYEFNNTMADYPKDKTIHKLFEEQVSKNPNQILISRGDVCISYNELNNRSNQLAWKLKELGVDIGDFVGLNTERTEELIIGILGILKSGAAYLPLNSEWPKERINFMLSDSCCTLLIHGGELIESNKFNCDLLDINNKGLYKKPKENLDLIIESSNIIYIIYTSGTIGNPKGVLTTHMNVSKVVLDNKYISINNSDNILQLSSYTFDGSVFDIFGALLNGSGLVMINNDDLLDLGLLLDIIEKKQISIFFITTALFNAIVDYGLSKLKNVRKILFGGELISVQHTQRALKELGEGKLVHVYGPTETTVFASYHNIDIIDEARDTIPIGTPLSNTFIYLFDTNEQLIPMGVPGELYIGGYGNAKGYLNNLELTNEKFITNPYNKEDVLYKTGDLARFLSNGSIEFLGRIDQQVKIRGFRIELGEIENVLLKHENIKESIVLAREEKEDKYLCAYVVTNEGNFDKEKVRVFLSKSLPDHMIPSYFVELDKMPLTTNGKVNRKELTLPEINVGNDYMPPSNEIEEKLVEIWSKVLEINEDKISNNINFFDLGGHSINILKLTKMVNIEFGCNISIANIFGLPTIKSIADYILTGTQEIDETVKDIDESIFEANERLNLLEDVD